MKQETRGKRKRICSAGAALVLAGILVIQTGLHVSAGENEVLGVADASDGQAESLVLEVSPKQAGETVPKNPEGQIFTEMPEKPEEKIFTEMPENREEILPAETPKEESGSANAQEPSGDPSGKSISGNSADTSGGTSEEDSLKTTEEASAPLQEMDVRLSVNSSLGENELKLEEGQEGFARSLFSEEEVRQGGQGNVLVYADTAENLLKPEAEKGEAQKLTVGERSSLEAEKEVLSQWAVQNEYEVQQYFALRLKKYRDKEASVKIAESAENLRMILKISDIPKEAQRAELVCVSDGRAAICGESDPDLETITFDGNTFGTYAVVFRITPEESATGELPEESGRTARQKTLVMEMNGGNAVYQPGTKGRWNPETHSYENGTSGHWIYEDGEGKIVLKNTGTEDLTVILSYQPSESYRNITGSFTDREGKPVQELLVAAGGIAEVYLSLSGEPDPGMSSEVIGNVAWTLAE